MNQAEGVQGYDRINEQQQYEIGMEQGYQNTTYSYQNTPHY